MVAINPISLVLHKAHLGLTCYGRNDPDRPADGYLLHKGGIRHVCLSGDGKERYDGDG